ncbi:unnamed protein product [Closterium sp. NIES-54]
MYPKGVYAELHGFPEGVHVNASYCDGPVVAGGADLVVGCIGGTADFNHGRRRCSSVNESRPSYPGNEVLRRCTTVAQVDLVKLTSEVVSRGRRERIRCSRGHVVGLAYALCSATAYTTVYDDLDDIHTDPEHRWDIATIMVQEALASWKGKAVKAAMDEEIRSLIGMGTWELVDHPRGVNIMKNWWVLMTKYHVVDTVAREKARLVVKGFTQVYGADYNKTYVLVSSYVTLRIFLSIVAVLDINLMQLNMKNAFLQSKLDRVLVYVDDLLAASSNTSMLRELKELLEAAFEREILPVVNYLGPARKLWLHQQSYADKLRMNFIDEEQKTPVSVDAYAELTFDDEEAQEREEEDYRQKVGSLQFAATMMRPRITFAYGKLGSGLTVRSDKHWHEVDCCLAYLALTCDTALEFCGGPESMQLVGYVDGDKQNRTNTGGYVSCPHRGSEAFSPPLFLTLEPLPVAPVAPPPSRPALSSVSQVTPQCLVPLVSGGAGGAVAEGEGTGPAGARGAGSRDVGGVRVETAPEEDTAVSTQWPLPGSPPGFPSVPQFPHRSPLWPVAAEPGGVPAGGTGDRGGVVGGGSGSRDRLEREERERFEMARQQQQQQQSPSEHQERVEEESQPYQERVEEESWQQQQQSQSEH